MKRCIRCVLPESYPNIQYDTNGVCNFCLDYQNPEYKGKKTFISLINEAKGKKSTYDVLVPWSGGRDSTYVLYKMVNDYGAGAIAYNYDNGFTSKQAKNNIHRIANRLGVEVVWERMKGHAHEKYLRELIHLYVDQPLEHTVLALCSICKSGIWKGAYRVAGEKGIPLVVFGESKMESGYAKKKLEERIIRTRRAKAWSAIKKPLNFVKRRSLAHKFNERFPTIPEECSSASVNYFDYLPWDENKMIDEISSALEWKSEVGQDLWRFDCMIHALVTHLNYALWGFSEKEELLSKMINEGMVSRDVALKRIQRPKQEMKCEREIIDTVFRRMNLEEKYVRYILDRAEEESQKWEK